MKRLFLMRYTLPALAIALVVAAPCFAQEATTSSAEDKAQALSLVKQLEEDPLASGAENARQWLTNFIVNAPDLFISTCPELLGPLNGQGKNGAPDIIAQLYFGNAAWAIQNPDKATDREAMLTGGLESTIRLYENLLKQKSRWRWPILDDLRGRVKKGTLADYVRENLDKCQ
ncbi:hypothetical protein EG835_12800 [bacterium]|nr:hypothetical protein [bacterium]